MSINKTHAFKQNKKLEDLVQDNNCFATQSFMLPKVTAITKDTENKELSMSAMQSADGRSRIQTLARPTLRITEN